MGGTKRSSDSITDPSPVPPLENGVKPKKAKKSSGKKPEAANGGVAEAAPKTVAPMELKKKRKAMDKLKHQAAAAAVNVEEVKSVEVEEEEGLPPQLHIGVFKELASLEEGVREAAAEMLVEELVEIQRVFQDRGGDDEVMENGTSSEDGLDGCAPSVRYAVRRLVLGVSSSRECARQGFALGLAVVFKSITRIDIGAFLKLIVSLLEVTSSMKGQDARDNYLGRLFSYGAVAGSGRLVQEWNSDKHTPYIKEFVSTVVALAGKKQYLQEPSVKVILQLVEKLPVQAVIDHVIEAPRLKEWFDVAAEGGNPDALFLALKLREIICVDREVFGKLLPNPFSASALFSNHHLSSLVNCLKESTFCQPRVHSVWPVLLETLIPDSLLQESGLSANSAKKHKKNRKACSPEEDLASNVHRFFEVIIEGSLLQSSHDRKHLALNVVLLLLRRVPASSVPVVMSNKLVQCLIDVLSTKEAWLHKVGLYFSKELSNCVMFDDDKRVAVILSLQKHSHGRFDSTTRTHTVKDLMAGFETEAGYNLISQSLKTLFLDEDKSSEEPSDQSQTTDDNSEIGSNEDKDSNGALGNGDSIKCWVIESLPGVIKHLKLDSEAKFRVQQDILKFLAIQGLFSPSLGTEVTSFDLQETFLWPKTATSVTLGRMCIEQLQQLFAYTQKSESSPHSVTEHNDLASYFLHFLSTLRCIPSLSLIRTLNDEEKQVLTDIQGMVTQLYKKERELIFNSAEEPDRKSKIDRLHVMRYMLIQLVLQEFLQPGQFLELAAELMICCETEMLLKDGERPDFIDVLVDTLLSLLPQSSAPTRFAIEQVFKYFCVDINDTTLLRMLRVVKEGLARRRQLDAEDEEDEEDDLFDVEESEEDELDEAESDGQTEESKPAAESEVLFKEQTEDNDGSGSDEEMDDDQMFKMDTYLAKIFRDKRNQAGGGDSTLAQLNLFKLRVLSLLEIFLQQNSEKSEVLTVYSHLARSFVHPQIAEGNQQLVQRIWSILQKRILKAKSIPNPKDCELSTLETLLEKSLKLVSKPFKRKKSKPSKKNRHKLITSLGQESTFWILKLIDGQGTPNDMLLTVHKILQDALVEYFDSKKCQLKPKFIKEIIRRRPWVRYCLFDILLDKCSSSESDFRRVEALDLVMDVLKSLVSCSSDKEGSDNSKKVLRRHLPGICQLVTKFVTNMPEKQSRRAEFRKFCTKVFQIILSHDLDKPFLKKLSSEAQTAFESQLGQAFLSLRN